MATTQDIQDIIRAAAAIAQQGINAASNTTTSIGDEIRQNSSTIQAIINGLLSNVGIVTDEQLNQLDEQMKLQKLKLLQLQTEKTKKKFIIYSSIVIAVFGTLWYLSIRKNN
jgi:hypothetical protein